jgi:hypothetical protein
MLETRKEKLVHISTQPVSKVVSKEVHDTGFVAGKCENLLIMTGFITTILLGKI